MEAVPAAAFLLRHEENQLGGALLRHLAAIYRESLECLLDIGVISCYIFSW